MRVALAAFDTLMRGGIIARDKGYEGEWTKWESGTVFCEDVDEE